MFLPQSTGLPLGSQFTVQMSMGLINNSEDTQGDRFPCRFVVFSSKWRRQLRPVAVVADVVTAHTPLLLHSAPTQGLQQTTDNCLYYTRHAVPKQWCWNWALDSWELNGWLEGVFGQSHFSAEIFLSEKWWNNPEIFSGACAGHICCTQFYDIFVE